MPLQTNDLRHTILKRISLDEFTPKTGDQEKVSVIGFFTTESYPGEDLYKFLSNSETPIRDVEVSPNPDEDGYYMVFVEVDRNENLIRNIKEITKEVARVSGNLDWCVKTPFMDGYLSLNDKLLHYYVQTNSKKYIEPQDFKNMIRDNMNKQKRKLRNKKAPKVENKQDILDFLKNTHLTEAKIIGDSIHMKDNNTNVRLRIVNFGPFFRVMKETNIYESAIKEEDMEIRKFNQMLGDLKSHAIDDFIVIYDPKGDEYNDILVTRFM